MTERYAAVLAQRREAAAEGGGGGDGAEVNEATELQVRDNHGDIRHIISIWSMLTATLYH